MVVDRHHFDPDPDPTFHFDADPDLDPTPSFTYVRKSEIFWTFIHSSACLHCFVFLTHRHRFHNVKFFDSVVNLLKWIRIRSIENYAVRTDPDPQHIPFFCGSSGFFSLSCSRSHLAIYSIMLLVSCYLMLSRNKYQILTSTLRIN